MSATYRALDLFCCAGGMSEGLRRAGFEVTGVDVRDLTKYYRGGRFVQADALTVPLDGFDFIHASPPCQAHSSLRHLHPGREYPDLIEPIRERLKAWGGPYSIENVPGAPLGGAHLVVLCGTMFGLQTPDGRAEIRRHRLFELSFCPDRQPPRCWHGGGAGDDGQGKLFGPLTAIGVSGTESPVVGRSTPRRALSVAGNTPETKLDGWTGRRVICVAGGKAMSGGMSEPQGMRKRRAMSITGTGNTPQTNVERNVTRETFSVDDARAAMGIDWMPMKYLSQAIPPAYGQWIGEQAIRHLEAADLTPRRRCARITP